jgi:hypothetical protein
MRTRRTFLTIVISVAVAACGPDSDDDAPTPADARLADAPTADGSLADAGVDATPPDAMVDAGPSTSDQIAAVRQAIHDAASSPVTLASLPIQGAVVTYVKPAFGAAVVGQADGPGFFVQNDAAGPALFFAVDPATFLGGAAVNVGDRVDLVVSEGRWLSCSGCTADNGMYVITAATGALVSTGNALPASQGVSMSDLVPLTGAPWPLEHELVGFTAAVSGAFGAAGGGFVAAQITTLGEPVAAPELLFRVPTELVALKGVAPGCTVTVAGTPAWRFADRVQLSAWAAGDFTVTCPALAVTATSPADAATGVDPLVALSFTVNQPLDAATLAAQTAVGPCTGTVQLSSDDFASCLGFAAAAPALSAQNTVATLTPQPALSYGQTYKLRVKAGVASTNGNTLAADHTVSFTTGGQPPSCNGSLVISQVYGGGGNNNAVFTHDFIEIHNRGGIGVSVAGWSVQYGSAGGTTWQATLLPSTVIPPGGYLLVQQATGGANGAALPTPDATGTINMSGTAGKVALVANSTVLTGANPSSVALVDLVGYGGANGSEGMPAPGLSATTAALRAGAGCTDTNDNAADFTAQTPAPRNAASAAVQCACGGDVTMNETGDNDEADFCNLQFPTAFTVQTGATTPVIYGRIFETAVTEAAGAPANVGAQVGYGPPTINPTTQPGWTWFDAGYNVQVGNDDEFQASFTAPAPGTWAVAYRFSQNGLKWTYCDANGAGSNAGLTFDVSQLGVMTVQP